ncbi:reverse transcriptase [Plakobranchus ocellatus]|uniref:Reverse transcriptase n=1 Tax=Plakobranchus ocellatus TaxID=259542 RepID=A0AAV4D8G6_9GAST|nr:reverse transcriptase [Plakobranchus ocellatus]
MKAVLASLRLEGTDWIRTSKSDGQKQKARALVFTSEMGRKYSCGSAVGMDTQRKSLLDGCGDWEFSANLPGWNKHPKVIQDTGMRPNIVAVQALLDKSPWSNSQYHTRVE